jgi:type II secretory pathway pseudopilin PulG
MVIRTRKVSRGYLAIEAIVGTMLIVALTAGVVAISSGQRRAAIAAAEMRSATRLAENALSTLQTHGRDSDAVAIRQLPDPAPAGWQWVQATAIVGSHHAVICGLTPQELTHGEGVRP